MEKGDSNAVRRVWLLSAYRSDSHAAWADWLTSNLAELDWQVRELPGRHFAWRLRGNALSWLDGLPETIPDRILATSMVDPATLKGLHPRLAGVPCDYYFHENQFAYPRSERQVTSLEARMVQLYGALAADRVWFNSDYNRRTFLEGVGELLARMPDHVPDGIGERLEAKSVVLPVPVEPVPPANERDGRLVVWNHRWEYDKNPDLFAEAVIALAEHGVDFRLALLEAASAGARPLVPDALCYPEQYPCRYRYPPGDATALADRLAEWLNGRPPPPADVSEWLAPCQGPAWRKAFAGA